MKNPFLQPFIEHIRRLPSPVSQEAMHGFLKKAWESNLTTPPRIVRTSAQGKIMTLFIVSLMTSLLFQSRFPDRSASLGQEGNPDLNPAATRPSIAASEVPGWHHRDAPMRPDTKAHVFRSSNARDDGQRADSLNRIIIPDSIVALDVYELDSMALARLGIYVEQDGQVYFASTRTSMGYESPGIIRYEHSFDRVTVYLTDENGQRVERSYESSSVKQPSMKSPARAMAYSGRKVPLHVMLTDSHGERYMYQTGYAHWNPPSLHDASGESRSTGKFNLGSDVIESDIRTYYLKTAGRNRITDLIPIRVKTTTLGIKSYPLNEQYLICWYEKTPELLELLPVNIREEIEYGSRRETQRPLAKEQHRPPDPPQPKLAALFPNPVTGSSATLSCMFDQPCSIGVGLYDIMGKKVKDVCTGEIEQSGEWSRQIAFDDVSAGLYLLAIVTDTGEMPVSRFVIRK